jgi:hypothetical protein
MIVVRVHQHGACIADNNHQNMGRSRGRPARFTRCYAWHIKYPLDNVLKDIVL